jgi:O-antigen ligase
MALFREHPLAGVGIGGFDVARGFGDGVRGDYPHNILLEVACELGVLGLVALLLLVWYGLRAGAGAMRRARTRQEFAVAATVLTVMVYFLANAMFSGDLNDNRLLFAALGLCASPVLAAGGTEVRSEN